jgi:hypothetical protein
MIQTTIWLFQDRRFFMSALWALIVGCLLILLPVMFQGPEFYILSILEISMERGLPHYLAGFSSSFTLGLGIAITAGLCWSIKNSYVLEALIVQVFGILGATAGLFMLVHSELGWLTALGVSAGFIFPSEAFFEWVCAHQTKMPADR